DKVLTFSDAQGKIQESYKNTSDELSILNGLMDDNAKEKRVSAAEVAKLVEKDASMVEMFKIENGQIVLNTQAINDKKNAMIEGFKQEAEAQRVALINQNKALLEKLGMYDLEIQGIATLGEQLDIVNKKYGEMIDADQ